MARTAQDESGFSVGGKSAVFTLVVVTLLYIINYMDRMVLSATLPLIKADLSLSDTQCGWLGSIYFIVVAVLTLPISILVDRWSRKKAISIMALLWSVATLLTGFGTRFSHLFLARGGVGVGEAGFAPGGIAFVSGSFPEKTRGKVLGVFNLGVPLGSILGVVLAGYVAEVNLWGLGWRTPFYLFAIPGILFGALVLFTRDYQTTDIVYEEKRGGKKEKITVRKGIVRILTTPTLLFTYFGVGAMSFVGGAVGHWLPTYFVRTRGIDVAKASMMMGGIIALAMVGPVAGGVVADYWKKRRPNARALTASVVSFLCGLILYIAVFVDIGKSYGLSYLLFICVGIMMFAYTAPAYAVSQDLVPRGLRSISMGVLVLITYGTLAAYAPVMVGWLSDILGEPGEPNLVSAFLFIPPVAFLAGFLFFLASRFHNRDMEKVSSAVNT
jgi:MFS family permease